MKGHQAVLFLTTSVILFLAVDAMFLRNLAKKVEKKQHEPEVFEPVLSHEFSDYETNEDGFIDYEEFVFPFMKKFKIDNLPDIREAYSKADKDGDGKLNEQEFAEFPLYDSAAEGGKEERGCGAGCGIRCRWWVSCSWNCDARC